MSIRMYGIIIGKVCNLIYLFTMETTFNASEHIRWWIMWTEFFVYISLHIYFKGSLHSSCRQGLICFVQDNFAWQIVHKYTIPVSVKLEQSSALRLTYNLHMQAEVIPSLEDELTADVPYSGECEINGKKVWIGASKAEGSKCDRCWNYSPKVGSFPEHPTLCSRCYSVVVIQSPRAVAAVSWGIVSKREAETVAQNFNCCSSLVASSATF